MTSQFGYSLCVCACTRFVSCSSNKISESSSQSLKHNMMSRSPKQGGKTYECILISGIQLVRDMIHCCYWGHNPNTVICCRFFPGDNDLRKEKGTTFGFLCVQQMLFSDVLWFLHIFQICEVILKYQGSITWSKKSSKSMKGRTAVLGQHEFNEKFIRRICTCQPIVLQK